MFRFRSKIFILLLLGLLLWFLPWVFALYTGVVVYFPYEPNGKDRYMRITGPLVKAMYANSDWAPGSEVNHQCRAALVAAEDMRFYEHWGVDPASIEDAIERNRKRGRIRWGGSTITQQLVKNIFLYRDKSYLRKAREMVGAIFLDLIMSKEDQITWYFNVVEFGPRIYGIGPAAQYYFRKKPKDLTLAQCVSLVSILPDPNRSSQGMLNGKVSRRVALRRQRILRLLSVTKALPPKEIQKANISPDAGIESSRDRVVPASRNE